MLSAQQSKHKTALLFVGIIAVAAAAIFFAGVHNARSSNNKQASEESSPSFGDKDAVFGQGDGGGGGSGMPWPRMTADECTDQYNGVLVGDIGNGAIYRDSYRCDSNGQQPIGTIVFDQSDTNIPIEGMVCCGQG
mmetsp:Transcript_627/g.1533  ORF Transcript_627/g.1533 Transcript_627/m.1533 type:complete len:135 (+) Transcript_627:150-554(+)